MIQVEDILKEATASLEAALEGLKWEEVKTENPRLKHYAGRGPEWTVTLIVLDLARGDSPQRMFSRMATAARGSLILKLTEEQCLTVHDLATR